MDRPYQPTPPPTPDVAPKFVGTPPDRLSPIAWAALVLGGIVATGVLLFLDLVARH